jgi:hypothetical protein
MLYVYYYQYEGETHICCVRGSLPPSNSPIWKNCNTCAWLVPGCNAND